MQTAEKADSAANVIITDLQKNLDQLASHGFECTAIFSNGGKLHKIAGVASGDFGSRVKLVSDHSHLVQKIGGADMEKLGDQLRDIAEQQRALFSSIIAITAQEGYAKLVDVAALAGMGIELTAKVSDLRDILAPA